LEFPSTFFFFLSFPVLKEDSSFSAGDEDEEEWFEKERPQRPVRKSAVVRSHEEVFFFFPCFFFFSALKKQGMLYSTNDDAPHAPVYRGDLSLAIESAGSSLSPTILSRKNVGSPVPEPPKLKKVTASARKRARAPLPALPPGERQQKKMFCYILTKKNANKILQRRKWKTLWEI
jgi:hypothetical protein